MPSRESGVIYGEASNHPQPKTYTINNPVTIHQSTDRKVSATHDSNTTSSGSHSKTGSGSSTTTSTVEETPGPFDEIVQTFMTRTQGRNVDYDAIDEDIDLIKEIYAMAEQNGEPVADYYDDLNEEEKAQKLVLMLI